MLSFFEMAQMLLFPMYLQSLNVTSLNYTLFFDYQTFSDFLKIHTGSQQKKYSLGIKQNSCLEVFELSKNGYFGVLSTSMP